MLWGLLALVANAQSPAEPESGGAPTFTFDQMLIPTFQALDPRHQLEADRIRSRLVAGIGPSHSLIEMDDVPGNWTDEYGPDLYMRACPPEQYGGCALSLAQRALADWAVGATLAENVDDPEAAHFVLTVYLVDVNEARDVAIFPVPLTEEEDAVVASIAEVVDLMVQGAFTLEDERDAQEEADREAIEVARRQVMAAYVAQLESELGTPEDTPAVATPPTPVTVDDVTRYDDDDGTPAWKQAGLSERAYARFLNSGEELEAWKQARRGRSGALVIRAAGSVGAGPWHQRYRGAILRSADDLQPIHVVQVLEATRGGFQGGELEVGVGVVPILDVSFVGGLHNGNASLHREEQVEGSLPLVGDPERPNIQTAHYGVRVTVAPWPRALIRPTVTTGIMWWQGAGVTGRSPYPPVTGPQRGFLQALPGVEVDTPGRVVGLFGRGGLEIPVLGSSARVVETGGGLADPPSPGRDGGPGWLVQVGLQLRVAPWRQ